MHFSPRRSKHIGLLAIAISTALGGCADEKPVYQTVWFHVPESPHLLAELPKTKKNWKQRLYSGLSGADFSDTSTPDARDATNPRTDLAPAPGQPENGY